jgi:hypothetical protein
MEGTPQLLHPLDSCTYTLRATSADDASNDASNNRADKNCELNPGALCTEHELLSTDDAISSSDDEPRTF